jgi:hypothetical protein
MQAIQYIKEVCKMSDIKAPAKIGRPKAYQPDALAIKLNEYIEDCKKKVNRY